MQENRGWQESNLWKQAGCRTVTGYSWNSVAEGARCILYVTFEALIASDLLSPMVQPQRDAPQVQFLSPLDGYYREAGLKLPPARELQPDEVPQPYRRLLCHDRDMTPTLEAAYGEEIRLRVLKARVRDEVVSREVVLMLNDGQPVEMGAIDIYLSLLPNHVRELIREGTTPLGAILHQEGVAHSSHPAAYFEIAPDVAIAGALDAGDSMLLYGRRNVLRHASGQVLAEVLEILPSTDPFSAR